LTLYRQADSFYHEPFGIQVPGVFVVILFIAPLLRVLPLSLSVWFTVLPERH